MDRLADRVRGMVKGGGWPGELALVTVVAVAIDLQIAVALEPSDDAQGWLGYVLGALMALVLLARKRWPLGVLAAVMAVLLVYNGFDLAGFSPVVPWAVPLYNAARTGRLWWAVAAAACAAGGTILVMLLKNDITTATALSRGVLDVALLGALVLLGETVRSRSALAEQMRRAAARAAIDREAEADRRATLERLHIARELHDVLAHTLAGVALQAGVAADTLTDDPVASGAAIETVRSACRQARTELAATLGVLRTGGPKDDTTENAAEHLPPNLAPIPGIDQLPGLFELARDAGVQVRYTVDGAPLTLPPAVGLAVYRIVQESLTNTVRHAAARSAMVALRYSENTLTVSVTDDGVGAAAGASSGEGGHGIVGMRERAVSIGGRIEIGDQPTGGYRVVATLPATDYLGAIR